MTNNKDNQEKDSSRKSVVRESIPRRSFCREQTGIKLTHSNTALPTQWRIPFTKMAAPDPLLNEYTKHSQGQLPLHMQRKKELH